MRLNSCDFSYHHFMADRPPIAAATEQGRFRQPTLALRAAIQMVSIWLLSLSAFILLALFNSRSANFMEYHARTGTNRFARCAWRRNRRMLLWLLAGLMLLPGGCVRRRLNVHSNPPGALVYVDNQQIGTTPCSVDFTYYGTREIRLVKPGYETLTISQPIPAPWYQIPPLDFVSENLVPTKIRDNRTVSYNLAPQFIVPTQELIDRANQLRQDTQQYPVAPASAISPTPTASIQSP